MAEHIEGAPEVGHLDDGQGSHLNRPTFNAKKRPASLGGGPFGGAG